MSTNTVPAAEFAKMLKKKYPQYRCLPDQQLIRAIVQKYPRYKASFDRDGTTLTGVTWDTLQSQPPSDPHAVHAAVPAHHQVQSPDLSSEKTVLRPLLITLSTSGPAELVRAEDVAPIPMKFVAKPQGTSANGAGSVPASSQIPGGAPEGPLPPEPAIPTERSIEDFGDETGRPDTATYIEGSWNSTVLHSFDAVVQPPSSKRNYVLAIAILAAAVGLIVLLALHLQPA